MRKIMSLGIVLSCVIVMVGCGTNGKEKVETQKSSTSEINSSLNTDKSENSSKSESTINAQGGSVDIIAKGEYFVGSDIKPGTYYIVLTELNYADDDPEKQAWVSFDISGKKPAYEMFFNVGSKKRIVLSDGDTVTFEDNYSPKSWMMRLLNDDDFKKYTEENK